MTKAVQMDSLRYFGFAPVCLLKAEIDKRAH